MIVTLPSRIQLISWVNKITNANITKIEQMSDAIQFSQIFDKMYPHVINLNKLKRGSLNNLQKQNNFKLLLNAINSVDIPVRLNILDLASGKIKPLLQLLQWFYKEYKIPTIINEKNQKTNDRMAEPTVFRSYISELVPRQISCLKPQSKEKSQQKVKRHGKSLESKRYSEHFYVISPDKDENNSKYEDMLIGQNHDKSNSQKVDSKNGKNVKIVATTTSEHFNKICEERKSQMKQQRSNKKNHHKKRTLQQCLEEAFNLSRKGLHKSLINVTETVIQLNPLLKSRIKQVLNNDIQKIQEDSVCSRKNKFKQSMNTSLNCEKSSVNKIKSNEKAEDITYPSLQEQQQNPRKDFSIISDKKNLLQQQITNLSLIDDIEVKIKKDTVKKSYFKEQDKKSDKSKTMSNEMINKESIQKQKVIINPQCKLSLNKSQKKCTNMLSNQFSLFNPENKQFIKVGSKNINDTLCNAQIQQINEVKNVWKQNIQLKPEQINIIKNEKEKVWNINQTLKNSFTESKKQRVFNDPRRIATSEKFHFRPNQSNDDHDHGFVGSFTQDPNWNN